MSSVIIRAAWVEVSEAAAAATDDLDARLVDGFTAAVGQTRIEQDAEEIVALVGMGTRGVATIPDVRHAARAIASRIAQAFPLASTSADREPDLIVDVDSFTDGVTETPVVDALIDGLSHGGYRFRMTTATTFDSRSFRLSLRPPAPLGTLAATTSTAVTRARDLVNLPPSALTPRDLAQAAARMLEPLGVRVKVRERTELEAGGFGGIVAIGNGSAHPPVLLELAFGAGRADYTFVGKGVTFDSGGLSLKSPAGLMTMKTDMAGAASVIGAFSLFPEIAPDRSIAGVIPLVENMPGSVATRPGDVVLLRDGSTLEILDTDFEGRVILADALALAAEGRPGAIVDVATLTYAAQHALGNDIAALFATDDALAARLLVAGERSGDALCRLPLQVALEPQIRSTIADYKNFPGVTDARTASAALLLSRFVGDVPWAHIDMVGPAFRETPTREGAAGATGFGVRLLAELVRRHDGAGGQQGISSPRWPSRGVLPDTRERERPRA